MRISDWSSDVCSSDLTTDDEHRVRRLTAAAENAWLGGRVERAFTLLETARPLTSAPIQQADIDRFLGLIEMTRGVPAAACQARKTVRLGKSVSVCVVRGGRRTFKTKKKNKIAR